MNAGRCDENSRGSNLLGTGAPFYDTYQCADGETSRSEASSRSSIGYCWRSLVLTPPRVAPNTSASERTLVGPHAVRYRHSGAEVGRVAGHEGECSYIAQLEVER